MDIPKDIVLNINSFISSNVENIYKHTESKEIEKYVLLLVQIAKERLKTKNITRINWQYKKITTKRNKILNDKQIKTMEWVLNNKTLVYEKVKIELHYVINKENNKL